MYNTLEYSKTYSKHKIRVTTTQRRSTMTLVIGIDYYSHTDNSKPSQVEQNWQTKTYTKVIPHFFQDE